MFVKKRSGRMEQILFDKISSRISRLCYGLDMSQIDPALVTMRIMSGIYSGITTAELDNLAAQECAARSTLHSDYGILAARIAVSNLHKETDKKFSAVVKQLYEYVNPKTDEHSPKVSREFYDTVMRHEDEFNSAIIYDRDYDFSYFGFKTLEKSYLMKITLKISAADPEKDKSAVFKDKVVERPQHMLMRVAIALHGDDVAAVLETYDLMSQRYFIHASPTLFNAGSVNPGLASCFVLHVEDSVQGIFKNLSDCALISKHSGGIGLNFHNIRSKGSYIKSTNGVSGGIVPSLRLYNALCRCITQGGRRAGSAAVYLDPSHPEIFEFLDLRKNNGYEEQRCRDLFLALWIPDLFMKRVEENNYWSLFSPSEAPGLTEVYGDEYEQLYLKYESEHRYKKRVKAQDLWFKILETQIESGQPYLAYRDAFNTKSNQKNIGIIRSSNLCCEIALHTSAQETAVCNLCSIGLPSYISFDEDGRPSFDFHKLKDVTKVVTKNLNKVINLTYYPTPEAKYSNLKNRPIGIGVSGLADVFIMMRFPFDSEEARSLNKKIFETIYFGALEASHELAVKDGPYEAFHGSPFSQGQFQFDLWKAQPESSSGGTTPVWSWETLRQKIMKDGVRNSVLTALMPTASTSQILGFNECFEPVTSNIYSRRVLSGEFQLVNKYLLDDLSKLGLWSEEIKNRIVAANGSVQSIDEIPADIKALYRTVWEIPQKAIIDLAADRAIYIDQSQSLNLFMAKPTYAKLSAMHFYAFKKGLKTGQYYLRSNAAADPIKFSIGNAKAKAEKTEEASVEVSGPVCTLEEGCLSCSA